MVDVSQKYTVFRMARAEGFVYLSPDTITALERKQIPKGNVLSTAKIAGIQGAKRAAELIPLCHPLNISWVDVELSMEEDGIRIETVVKAKESTGVEIEALTAVSIAALTIYDMCKTVDQSISISGIRLIEKKGGKTEHLTQYRPKVGVMVLSDSIYAGEKEDISGNTLKEGFEKAGCKVDYLVVLPDGSPDLEKTINSWINDGIELILTSGGTGLGPRDLTLSKIEKLFQTRLSGIEYALHTYGQLQVQTSMLSTLAAGIIEETIIVCLPGSPGAAKDALEVLIPSIFHAYPILQGKGHADQTSD